VYNQSLHFKRVVRHVGEPMAHEESVASSAVSTSKSLGQTYFTIESDNLLFLYRFVLQ
jgi:hypothetical protein